MHEKIDYTKEIALNKERGLEEINTLALELGYESVGSASALGITEEEMKSLVNFNKRRLGEEDKCIKFLLKKLPEDKSAKAIIKVLATRQSPYFTADIFSPSFSDGHAGSNDFTTEELKINLAEAGKI